MRLFTIILLQVDHLEEDLNELETFKSLRDPYLEEDQDGKSSIFFNIQKQCLRSHSRRPTSSEVASYSYC